MNYKYVLQHIYKNLFNVNVSVFFYKIILFFRVSLEEIEHFFLGFHLRP